MTYPETLAVLLAVNATKKPGRLTSGLPRFPRNHAGFVDGLGCRDSNPNCLIQSQIDPNDAQFVAFAASSMTLQKGQSEFAEFAADYRLAVSWLSHDVYGCPSDRETQSVETHTYSFFQSVGVFEVLEESPRIAVTARNSGGNHIGKNIGTIRKILPITTIWQRSPCAAAYVCGFMVDTVVWFAILLIGAGGNVSTPIGIKATHHPPLNAERLARRDVSLERENTRGTWADHNLTHSPVKDPDEPRVTLSHRSPCTARPAWR